VLVSYWCCVRSRALQCQGRHFAAIRSDQRDRQTLCRPCFSKSADVGRANKLAKQGMSWVQLGFQPRDFITTEKQQSKLLTPTGADALRPCRHKIFTTIRPNRNLTLSDAF